MGESNWQGIYQVKTNTNGKLKITSEGVHLSGSQRETDVSAISTRLPGRLPTCDKHHPLSAQQQSDHRSVLISDLVEEAEGIHKQVDGLIAGGARREAWDRQEDWETCGAC